MNHIHRLTRDLAAARAESVALREGINGIRAHLLSEKFHRDTTIQTMDVELRLMEVLVRGSEAESGSINAYDRAHAEDA